MSEEEESIHDNADLSNSKEEEAPTEPEIEPKAPEPEPEVEIISSVTEEKWSRRGSQNKTKKVDQKHYMKIQKFLADTSKQVEKQTVQFNKINQNLQSPQKQFNLG